MFGKMICALILVGSAAIACGPAASLNANEGNSCSAQNNDCGGDLNCQPIANRGDFCCPTPASASSHANCQTGGSGSAVAIP
jgi:hypothetical protein